MVKRVLVATLLGGLLLLGTPSVATAIQRGDDKSDHRMDGRIDRVIDRRIDRIIDRRVDRRIDRIIDRSRHHRFVFVFHNYPYYPAYYYPYYPAYYSRCGYSYGGYPRSGYYGRGYGGYSGGGFGGYSYGSGYQYGGGYGDQYGSQYDDEGIVVLRNIYFNPPRVTTEVGRDVVWSWQDCGITHTVTADNGSFDSGPIRAGEFRLVFDHPGRYPYHCEIHPDRMRGVVIVT
jgi:plastocyanin